MLLKFSFCSNGFHIVLYHAKRSQMHPSWWPDSSKKYSFITGFPILNSIHRVWNRPPRSTSTWRSSVLSGFLISWSAYCPFDGACSQNSHKLVPGQALQSSMFKYWSMHPARITSTDVYHFTCFFFFPSSICNTAIVKILCLTVCFFASLGLICLCTHWHKEVK